VKERQEERTIPGAPGILAVAWKRPTPFSSVAVYLKRSEKPVGARKERTMKGSTCICIGLLCVTVTAWAGPTVEVNVQDNAVVGDVLTVKARPASEAGIARVEFSVDDQLRATVTQPPYEYKWDTIDEDEGRHTLSVAVLDGDGKAATKRIKVEVDNGLSQGVKPHADRALESFRRGEYDAALLAARKAYKISQTDIDAIRAMAAGVGGTGDFNRALDLLEKPPRMNNQVVGDPKNFPLADRTALELRGLFHVRRAGTQPNAAAMLPDLAAAYELGRRLDDLDLKELRAKYPGSDQSAVALLAVGDALFLRGDYEEALALYKRVPADSKEGVAAQNRVALALLRLNRLRDAELLLNNMIGGGPANDATHAILGAVYLQQRRFAQARKQAEGPAQRRSLTGLIVLAYADLALLDYRRAYEALQQAAARGPLPEVAYLAALLFTDTGDLKRATDAFIETIARMPTLLDAHTLRGYQLAWLVPSDGFAQAQALFDFVLKRDPFHAGAKMGKAVALIQQKKCKAAEPLLKDLARDDRTAGDVWVGLAAVHADGNRQQMANDALAQARRLEPQRFKDVMVPRMPEFVRRVARYRRPPLLTPALLALEEGRK